MAEIWCPLADGAHVLVGHVPPLVVVVVVGAALGYGLFGLRRVSAYERVGACL